jgi:hypothetical protein
MQDEFLTRCVVDPLKRTVYLYSSDGNEKQVSCETVQEFMNVLDFVRATVDEEYSLIRKSTLSSILEGKKSPAKFYTRYFFMNPSRIDIKSLKEQTVKTTPENVKESNQALFSCTMTLPAAAKHCGMTHKEMKMTFLEYLKYHPITYLG